MAAEDGPCLGGRPWSQQIWGNLKGVELGNLCLDTISEAEAIVTAASVQGFLQRLQ